MFELILGGARSGKSSYAESLAKASGKQLVYIATASAGDAEMAQRIQMHQQQRAADQWHTHEEELLLAKAISQFNSSQYIILVDCLTLWLTNCLLAEETDAWPRQKQALLDLLDQLEADLLCVSNEVGSGIVPLGELSRQFVDEAGWLNQALAAKADKVSLVVAGLPTTLKDSL